MAVVESNLERVPKKYGKLSFVHFIPDGLNHEHTVMVCHNGKCVVRLADS